MKESNIISIKIKQEEDLYIPFSPEKELNEVITEYIASKIDYKTSPDSVIVQIISDEAVQELDVRRAFAARLDAEKNCIRGERRSNLIKQLWLLAVGIVFVALSLFLEPRISAIRFTVLSTIGSFAIWEAAAIWIVEDPKLRRRNRILKIWRENIELQFEHK